MPMFKRGSDNLWNGMILGAVAGLLIAGADIASVQTVVNQVMQVIPSSWISWAGENSKLVVFGLAGAIIGYIVDYY